VLLIAPHPSKPILNGSLFLLFADGCSMTGFWISFGSAMMKMNRNDECIGNLGDVHRCIALDNSGNRDHCISSVSLMSCSRTSQKWPTNQNMGLAAQQHGIEIILISSFEK
jgi:hypothetical protein